jgi:hypothetical protein
MATVEHHDLDTTHTTSEAIFQDKLNLLYPTSEEVLLGQAPHIVTHRKHIDETARPARTRIALSDIEALWPWYRETIDPTVQQEYNKSPDKDMLTTAAVIGTRLHQAYTAYGIVLQGLSGPAIDQAMPTLSPKRRSFLKR